jgi:hypothetical protein
MEERLSLFPLQTCTRACMPRSDQVRFEIALIDDLLETESGHFTIFK